MTRFIITGLFLFLFINLNSQETSPYQKGVTAERNLSTVANISPYSPGGVGFDNRYEGVKGSPRLFDKLQPTLLLIKGDTNFFKINGDLDVFQNRFVFSHPKTGKLLSIPSEIVSEVIITVDGKNQVYRMVQANKFDNKANKGRFCQALDEKLLFIRIPVKVFNEANYKGIYSPDKRYDEFELKYQYYYMSSDSIYHKVQPNQKTLLKLFPENKSVIESVIREKKYSGNDEMMVKVIERITGSPVK